MSGWKQWAAKVDALSLRERVLLFAAVAACAILLAHAAALQPLLRLQRSYVDRLKQNETQLNSINEALLKGAEASKNDPAAAKRERIRSLEARLAEVERLIAVKRTTQATPEQLSALLREVLGPNRALRVVALRVLPPTPLAEPIPVRPTVEKAARAPSSHVGTPPLYRHSVEIELIGSYLEILKYLEDIADLRWSLSWSSIELNTARHPEIQLRATLSAVSTSPTLIEL